MYVGLLTECSVDKPGTAETAPPWTAAADLDQEHVAELNAFGQDLRRGGVILFKAGRGSAHGERRPILDIVTAYLTLAVGWTIQGRDIDTGNSRQVRQQGTPHLVPARRQQGRHKSGNDVLPFADADDIHENRHRFGVDEKGRPAGDDQRVRL